MALMQMAAKGLNTQYWNYSVLTFSRQPREIRTSRNDSWRIAIFMPSNNITRLKTGHYKFTWGKQKHHITEKQDFVVYSMYW